MRFVSTATRALTTAKCLRRVLGCTPLQLHNGQSTDGGSGAAQAGRSLTEVHDALKPLMLQDLRIQCRARGISPAGSRQTLLERLGEHMMATGDLCALNPVKPNDTRNHSINKQPVAAISCGYIQAEQLSSEKLSWVIPTLPRLIPLA